MQSNNATEPKLAAAAAVPPAGRREDARLLVCPGPADVDQQHLPRRQAEDLPPGDPTGGRLEAVVRGAAAGPRVWSRCGFRTTELPNMLENLAQSGCVAA